MLFISRTLPPGVKEGRKIGVVGCLSSQQLGRVVLIKDALLFKRLALADFATAWSNLLMSAVVHPGEYLRYQEEES